MSKTPRTFLASLRRDRLAFAILATLVLFAGFLKPLAEARAANGPNAGVICSTFGSPSAGPDGQPVNAAADDCPYCIAGHGPAVVLLPELPSACLPVRVASPAQFWARADAGSVGAPVLPPSIRGPPAQA